MKQERVRKPRALVKKNTRTEVIDQDNRTRSAKNAEALEAELNAVLDDIDRVLEENAIEGLTAEEAMLYKQVGGE